MVSFLETKTISTEHSSHVEVIRHRVAMLRRSQGLRRSPPDPTVPNSWQTWPAPGASQDLDKLMNMPAAYTVLRPHAEIVTEFARKRSRFLTVMRRADSADAAQELVDELRREYHSARHHCSAWAVGPDRRIQRANDDGEPSGTAGAPMLEALSKAEMPSGTADLSDAVVVVVRWFGGTLLGAGGLVGAYSDSVVNAVEHAQRDSLLIFRRRMRTFSLEAPVTEAGRWENELRGAETSGAGITVLGRITWVGLAVRCSVWRCPTPMSP